MTYIPRPTASFAQWFVRHKEHVCPGWDIDYSTAQCPDCFRGHKPACFRGAIVKYLPSNHIWRLTGKIDSGGWFEGRWPD